MTEFLTHILCLCMQYDGSVTSWVRSKTRNTLIGGHANSFHLKGLAVDVVLDDRTKDQAFHDDVERLGYKALIESTHIHCQIK